MSVRRRGRSLHALGAWTESALGASADPDALQARLARAASRPPDSGDFLVFGPGLGFGTMTDGPAIALARLGIGAILCEAIDPRFRDALLHVGVPVAILPEARARFRDGDDVTLDLAAGTVENATQRKMALIDPLEAADLRTLRVAPSLAWYGLDPRPADPDVVESGPTEAAATTQA